MSEASSTNAFILRIAPGQHDMVAECLARDEILIGWHEAAGLLDLGLSWPAFRTIVASRYYPDQATQHRAGSAAGQLWRFIRSMRPGDLVVVPHPGVFYVAQLTGEAEHGTQQHPFYCRSVRWLNDRQPIFRKIAPAALQSRMKVQISCADAGDLVDVIRDCVDLAQAGETPTFHQDLQTRLVQETIAEIRSGRLDSYGFETLIREVMLALGAKRCAVTARMKDKGADLVATFLVAGVFEFRIAIQAKHYYRTDSALGREVVGEVIRGIEAENANLGMIITAGRLSDEASEAARAYLEEKGGRIELIDGEQFAALIVEHGLGGYGKHQAALT